jgi:hypothetical protein
MQTGPKKKEEEEEEHQFTPSFTIQLLNSSAYVKLSLEISLYTISTVVFHVKNYKTISECGPTWRHASLQ